MFTALLDIVCPADLLISKKRAAPYVRTTVFAEFRDLPKKKAQLIESNGASKGIRAHWKGRLAVLPNIGWCRSQAYWCRGALRDLSSLQGQGSPWPPRATPSIFYRAVLQTLGSCGRQGGQGDGSWLGGGLIAMQQSQQVLVGGVGRDCWRVVHRLLSRGRDSGTGDCAVPGLLLLKWRDFRT